MMGEELRKLTPEAPWQDPGLTIGKVKTRGQEILETAACIFARKGFDATTIRDIADAAGVLSGSLYYHFSSKEEIFLAVHQAGMEKITASVVAALEGVTDPWDRLETLAIAHCEALLSSSELPVIVSPYFSNLLAPVRRKLIAQRDRYEKLVVSVVDELNLPAHIDATVFRLHFLGALNWVPTWYNPSNKLKPHQIATQLVTMLRGQYNDPGSRVKKPANLSPVKRRSSVRLLP